MGQNPKTQVSQNGNDIKVEVEVEGATGTGQNSSAANSAGASAGAPTSASRQSYRQSGEAAGRAFRDAKKNATEVFDGMAPGHGNEIFFGLVGLLAAVLFFVVGFWQTLAIVLLVIVGVAFGQWVDGKPTILNAVKRLFTSNDN